MSVAWRQIRGLALLKITDNKRAFCIHEKSPIMYWLSLTHSVFQWLTPRSNSHYREHCTLIKGNNKPLVSAARKYEEASARSRGTHDSVVKKCSASLLLSAFLCFNPPPLSVLPVTSRKAWWQGDREATEQQSKSDYQGISQKLNSVSFTGGHVLQFGDSGPVEWDTHAF